jgi:hypothetical protein
MTQATALGAAKKPIERGKASACHGVVSVLPNDGRPGHDLITSRGGQSQNGNRDVVGTCGEYFSEVNIQSCIPHQIQDSIYQSSRDEPHTGRRRAFSASNELLAGSAQVNANLRRKANRVCAKSQQSNSGHRGCIAIPLSWGIVQLNNAHRPVVDLNTEACEGDTLDVPHELLRRSIAAGEHMDLSDSSVGSGNDAGGRNTWDASECRFNRVRGGSAHPCFPVAIHQIHSVVRQVGINWSVN